jgi:hypothetical protein
MCYLLTLIIVSLCGRYSKSGPCTIGFDIISWALAMIISALLILINLVRVVLYRKRETIHVLLVNIIGGIMLVGMGFIHT